MVQFLSIHGARAHNLKNISLDIPRGKLSVITGLSGSGKSSLAFDTIYAEGHRRYVESLSAYARQFLNLSNKPDVDRIDGLSPAIAIEQKTTSRNPRSTVGTITEIYDYLRLLYAQVGTPYCPNGHGPIETQTVSQMVDTLMGWDEGTRLQILAPVVRGRKGEYRKELLDWQKQGFTRVRVNGEIYDIGETPALDKQKKHTLEVVVDRLAIREDNKSRLADSLETALKLADGLAAAEEVVRGGAGEIALSTASPRNDKTGSARNDKKDAAAPKSVLFSERHSCRVCGYAMPDIEPRLFSFNSPYGACTTCDGLGEIAFFDPALIVPDENLSLGEGAVHPWKTTQAKTADYYLKPLSKHYKFDLATKWKALPEKVRDVILYGSGDEAIAFTFEGAKARFHTHKPFDGIVNILERRWRESSNPMGRDDLNRYRATKPCPDCGGARLNRDALSVFVDGRSVAEVTDLSVKDALAYYIDLRTRLAGNKGTIAAPILKEIAARLGFLEHVGLGYLTLSRQAGTLSGGESQRIRLASQIGSGLTGVLYVLDEPSIGLHQRDNHKLLETLQHLRDMDNTILVVEHDEDAMRTADFVVDMGPGAGEHGGEVVASGPVADIIANENSLTGQYLSGKRCIAVPKRRRAGVKGQVLSVQGASENNLQDVTVAFPLGVLTCVTGVSGSGKSTLVMDTVYPALARQLNKSKQSPGKYNNITGIDKLDKVVNIDQSPIGRTPRSNPATYTGVMGPIREWFAKLPEARSRGYTPGRFSFNVKGGRCEACQGDGMIRVEMHFLPDVYVECEVCHGKRFNRETLEVTYRGKSIADVLEMTVEQGRDFFEAVPAIRSKLQTLMDVGLSYIRLGQSATTLSGGEAQRIKLAKELARRSTGQTMYILDEPTTGLHFEDIRLLLGVLHRLVDEGNSMVIIEHNLDVIKTADHIIDIGPEGGDGGGRIIAEGTPEAVAKVKDSYTGQFLKGMLGTKKGKVA